MIEIQTQGSVIVKGRGLIFLVSMKDNPLVNFPKLVGQTVLVDGKYYKVNSLEFSDKNGEVCDSIGMVVVQSKE